MNPLTGAAWSENASQHFGRSDGGICKRYNEGVAQSLHHIRWECNCYNMQREEADHLLANFPSAALPIAAVCDIAPAMAASLDTNQ